MPGEGFVLKEQDQNQMARDLSGSDHPLLVNTRARDPHAGPLAQSELGPSAGRALSLVGMNLRLAQVPTGTAPRNRRFSLAMPKHRSETGDRLLKLKNANFRIEN